MNEENKEFLMKVLRRQDSIIERQDKQEKITKALSENLIVVSKILLKDFNKKKSNSLTYQIEADMSPMFEFKSLSTELEYLLKKYQVKNLTVRQIKTK